MNKDSLNYINKGHPISYGSNNTIKVHHLIIILITTHKL